VTFEGCLCACRENVGCSTLDSICKRVESYSLSKNGCSRISWTSKRSVGSHTSNCLNKHTPREPLSDCKGYRTTVQSSDNIFFTSSGNQFDLAFGMFPVNLTTHCEHTLRQKQLQKLTAGKWKHPENTCLLVYSRQTATNL
jgi:hypothetical protein